MKLVRDDDQLTLDVQLHPELRTVKDPYITGVVKISGDVFCPHDLNSGDEVTITVANADGEVIGTAKANAMHPGFRDIKDRDEVIGTERVNRVKID